VQLPAIEYGDWPSVKARIRKVMTQLKRGGSFNELMAADGLLDTATHGGLIFIDGPNSIGGGPHFQAFAAARLIGKEWLAKRVPDALWDSIFTASLETPWGVLGLFGHNDTHWLWPHQKRFEPFLHAALAVWKELDAVGPRYSPGVGYGKSLWEVTNALHYVLANLGVPDELLGAPLPPEGPTALLRYVKPTH
jgi:hypothetical protein